MGGTSMMSYTGGLEEMIYDYDRDSWEWHVMQTAIETLEKYSKMENELNSRISYLEEHSGTLHEIIHGQTDVGSKKCNVCGWRK